MFINTAVNKADMEDLKSKIIEILKKETGLAEVQLEIPPDKTYGDFAFPCFTLAKTMKKNPAVIATELAEKFRGKDYLERIEVKGAYINFFVNKASYIGQTLQTIFAQKTKFGTPDLPHEKILIEYSAPNTNKPMHLGHVRNNVLGDSLSRILSFAGHKVIRVNLINDRGVHICKAMVSYQKWGAEKTPSSEKKKGDHFIGDYYVLFAQHAKEHPELEQEAQHMLQLWEKKDKNVYSLWKKTREWVLSGFEKTYKRMNITFDQVYYESEIYEGGRDMILSALKSGKAEHDAENNIIINLDDLGYGRKVLLRADGTSIYITQDLYLAKKKFTDYTLDRSIYVVGSEQEYHFKVLFATLDRLGYDYGKKSFHFSYGMVLLPEGKMKSREGTVVDADDIMDEVVRMARDEIKKRNPDIKEKELQKRSESIGQGALRFFILKNDPVKSIMYNPAEAISFEGETGPYVQYACARISSILEKAGQKAVPRNPQIDLLTAEEEKAIITILTQYPTAVAQAVQHYRPSAIAHYLLNLSQAFNNYYHIHTVISDDKDLMNARLALIIAVRQVLENGLELLGIDSLDKM
jgi:arginyl-tRNA synthetase